MRIEVWVWYNKAKQKKEDVDRYAWVPGDDE